jgi:hypothetical protein
VSVRYIFVELYLVCNAAAIISLSAIVIDAIIIIIVFVVKVKFVQSWNVVERAVNKVNQLSEYPGTTQGVLFAAEGHDTTLDIHKCLV